MCEYVQPPHDGSANAARRSADGSSTPTVSAKATPLPTRSIRAWIRSPGMAPPTSTTWPSRRAIMRPPAAGLSTPSVRIWPAVSIGTLGERPGSARSIVPSFGVASFRAPSRFASFVVEGDARQLQSLADERVKGALTGARQRFWRHAGAKRGQRFFHFVRQGRTSGWIEQQSCLLEQIRVERCQAGDQLLPRLAANASRLAPRHFELGSRAIDERIERRAQRALRSRLGQPQHHALQMRRQRVTGTGRLGTYAWRLKTDTHRPAPFVEYVENVRLAEVDLHRATPRTLAIVALEAAIDGGPRDFERHALHRPAGDEIERRTGDANQMPVILAAEIRLDLPAVLRNPSSEIRDAWGYWFLSHTSLRPWSVKSASTCSMSDVSGAITSARPPVAMHSAPPPSSSLMRRTSPSTMPTYPQNRPASIAPTVVRPITRDGFRTSMRGSRAAR